MEILGATTTILYGFNILFDPVHEDLPYDQHFKGLTVVSHRRPMFFFPNHSSCLQSHVHLGPCPHISQVRKSQAALHSGGERFEGLLEKNYSRTCKYNWWGWRKCDLPSAPKNCRYRCRPSCLMSHYISVLWYSLVMHFCLLLYHLYTMISRFWSCLPYPMQLLFSLL